MQVWCYTQCWFGSGSHCGSSQKFQCPSLAWSPSCCSSRTPVLPGAGSHAAIAALNQAQHLVLLLLSSEVLQFLQCLT